MERVLHGDNIKGENTKCIYFSFTHYMQASQNYPLSFFFCVSLYVVMPSIHHMGASYYQDMSHKRTNIMLSTMFNNL